MCKTGYHNGCFLDENPSVKVKKPVHISEKIVVAYSELIVIPQLFH